MIKAVFPIPLDEALRARILEALSRAIAERVLEHRTARAE